MTQAFLAAIAPGQDIFDFRAIHDSRKDIPAIPLRGRLVDHWQKLHELNRQGYGIFCMINETDGQGRDSVNVRNFRAQFIDLDGPQSQENFNRAICHSPQPSFFVQSSVGKFHIYWAVSHSDHALFTDLQRRLLTLYGGDPVITDPARVMRLPGFYHCKAMPVMVTYHALEGGSADVQSLFLSVAGVTVSTGGGGRHDLGEPKLAAPSVEWIKFALDKIDPNGLSRGEWVATMAAVKQAGWQFGEPVIQRIFNEWCSAYTGNNPSENAKQWRSIRNTESGWPGLVKRSGILPYLKFMENGGVQVDDESQQPAPMHTSVPYNSPILSGQEQYEYFKGCVAVNRLGRILTPSGRLMNATEFNMAYGGKDFIINQAGKVTDEPWKAATRGQMFTIKKVDHLRFLPMADKGEIIIDELGRTGVNTYIKPNIAMREGDITLFLQHLELIIPVARDRDILLSYMAHNVQKPGFKIWYCPLIQSSEGAGKTVLKMIMTHALGSPYIHNPNARELTEGGGKFNSWMRSKLMIIVDEIKVDDKRDLIEVLKPMITDERIEIQGKGQDQETEDNFANWMMFSNYKDAIPISQNGRRYSIFYTSIQSKNDLLRLKMDGFYFKRLYDWLRFEGGMEKVTWYLVNYQIPDEFNPSKGITTAPETSSTDEAIENSRSSIEIIIQEAIETRQQGFMGGWVSTLAINNLIKRNDLKPPGPRVISLILENMGLYKIGRAGRLYFNESPTVRTVLYNYSNSAIIDDYGIMQDYNYSNS